MKQTPLRKFLKLSLFILILILTSCGREEKAPSPECIQAHSSGEISSASSLSVVFTYPIGIEGKECIPSPFRIKPGIEGRAVWTSSQTLSFIPETALESGRTYKVDFVSDLLVESLGEEKYSDDNLGNFNFEVSVIRQELVINPGILIIPDPETPEVMEYQGTISAADEISLEDAAGLIEARYENNEMEVKLTAEIPGKEFNFRIPHIEKGESSGSLLLKLDGAARSSSGEKTLNLEIPGKDVFTLLSVVPVTKGGKYIEIVFSTPLSEVQDLRGLIGVKDNPDIQVVSRSNRVKIYNSSEWSENLEVIIEREVEDSSFRTLVSSRSVIVNFPTEKPQVRFIGDGVILPTSQGTTVPIETMNLNSVMVEAVKIHGQNIPQFLQINNIDESREMVRVGETVWRKVINLEWQPENADKWLRYGLDLSPLLELYPDGFFHLKVTFRKPHIEYECNEGSDETSGSDPDDFFSDFSGEPETQAEASFWDNFQSNQSWEYRRNRKDPCHPAYYQVWYDHNIAVSKNILVSNVGIISAEDNEGTLLATITDLRSAAPSKGARVGVYNYQNRLLTDGITDEKGQIELHLEESPFFIYTETADDYGYLRLNTQAIRTTSHFDTGGVQSVDGIEGYIYGERGVWRPGDRIYLNFILQDKYNTLPEDHPVLFQFLDPWGKEVSRNISTDNTGGFYSFYTETAPEAPTGNYHAKIMVGGKLYEKIIKVETVMPNRLKVNLNLGNEGEGLVNGSFTGHLDSEWLHGAPASGLKADIKVHFGPSSTSFPQLSDYIFDDPAREIRAQRQTIYSGTLDESGGTDLNGSFNVSGAPGRLNAFVTTRIFEPGGAFSTEQVSYPFNPFDRYVGLKTPRGDAARGMLLTDEDQTVDIAMVDTRGNPIGNGRVNVEIFKLNWRWWWETEEENLVSYVNRSSLTAIRKDEVEISDGRGSWNFQIHYPDWGRYLIRVTDREGGHSTGKVVYIDWPGWAGRAQEEGSGGAAMLVLTTDKTKYEVGDDIVLSIPSSQEGRALLTLEKSGRIIESRWFQTGDGTSRMIIRADEDMTPNIYAHVTYLQPHLQTMNDRPIRTYGVIPIQIENIATRLNPVITAPRSFHPEEPARITIRESEGKAMTYTLAMVDEGLLGITRFRTGNPWYHFYRKEASFLKTWDLYDYVAGAYTGVLNTLLAVGGGMGGDEPEGGRKVNRFAPVVEVLPPVYLEAGGVNIHEIDMPLYVGAVRLMVVAAHEGAYGRAEQVVPVKKEIMVLGTAPRVLSINEKITLPVSVFSMDERIDRVEVSVDVQGPIKIVGLSARETFFEVQGENLLDFSIEAEEAVGEALIKIRARGNGYTAEHEIPIEVRIPSAPITEVEAIELPGGGVWTGGINLPGVSGTNKITLELSRIPPVDLTRRLEFLLGYPHGCIEQITSRVFPQLYLGDLVSLTEEEWARQQHNIESAVSALKGFQTYSGGFSYWPGQSEPNEWGTNYAGHFILEAENKGWDLPQGMKDKWLNYQKSRCNDWNENSREGMRNQAYRLYTLALAGEADLPAMNRLREKSNLDTAALWRLAMAYNLAGYRREANDLVNGASTYITDYQETGGTYGSTFRDKAMMLETMVTLNKRTEAVRLAREVSEVLSSDLNLSTQETGYALMSISRFSSAMTARKELAFEYSWNNGGNNHVSTTKPVIQVELDSIRTDRGQLTIRNSDSTVLFARIITSGSPLPGREQPVAEGLALSVNYKRADGTVADLDNLIQGEDLEVTLTLENRTRQRLEEIAISHLLPAGWEVHNDRIGGNTTSMTDYQDIRDDRVYTYLDLPSRGRKQITLLVNNSYKGRFYMPLITAGTMYNPEYQTVIPGRWITIDSEQ